jgi:hypothetical protein
VEAHVGAGVLGTAMPILKQLGMVGLQTNLDIAPRFVPGELRKGHDAKQFCTTERADFCIALVSLDDASKSLPRTKLHYLRKNELHSFMRRSRSSNPESIANQLHAIQIVDTPTPP